MASKVDISVSVNIEDLISEVGVDELLNAIGNKEIERWVNDNYTHSEILSSFDITVGDVVEYHSPEDCLEESIRQKGKISSDTLLELVDRAELLKTWKDLYE